MIKLNLTGRLGVAPCGHPGEFLIGQYVQCLAPNCDGLPHAGPRCNRCDSTQMEPFVAVHMPEGTMHCIPCGAIMWSGVSADDQG